MSIPPENAPDEISLDRVYDEYVRLGGICNDYLKDALGDIRLFGAIGALLVWDPLSRLLELEARLAQPVTPIGFLVLLLVIVLVMFFNLVKQSILFFHLSRLWELERVLNRACGEGGELFQLAGGWPSWYRRYHRRVVLGLWGYLYLLVVALPPILLFLQDYAGWLFVYLPTSVLLLGLHAWCARRISTSLAGRISTSVE